MLTSALLAKKKNGDFMEHVGSSPYSEQPETGPYPQPVKPSSHSQFIL